jgi:hypothetical protein
LWWDQHSSSVTLKNVMSWNWTCDLIEVMLISAFVSHGTVADCGATKMFNMFPHNFEKHCKSWKYQNKISHEVHDDSKWLINLLRSDSNKSQWWNSTHKELISSHNKERRHNDTPIMQLKLHYDSIGSTRTHEDLWWLRLTQDDSHLFL